MDGAAIINMLSPDGRCKGFDQYANFVFIPHLVTHLGNTKWLDVVWDKYILGNSLKQST